MFYFECTPPTACSKPPCLMCLMYPSTSGMETCPHLAVSFVARRRKAASLVVESKMRQGCLMHVGRVRSKQKQRKQKLDIPPHSKDTATQHSSSATATQSRRLPTKQVPQASPSSPVSVDAGCCGDRARAAHAVNICKNTIIMDRQYTVIRSIIYWEACMHPAIYTRFCH